MALTKDRIAELRRVAHRVRKDALSMVHAAGCGHPGGPLGMADFMTVLFMEHLNLTPENLHAPDRDRFILGNGHTCAGYYALLAAKALLPREELLSFRKFGSALQGHPHRNLALGIDFSTDGTASRKGRSLVLSKAAQPPSVFCIASSQARPRAIASAQSSRPRRAIATNAMAVSSVSG